MNYSKLTAAFFSLIILFVSVSSASPSCFLVQCNQSEPIITSPFWIPGKQPESCGYRGFSLLCDGGNRTILDLPQSGKFKVESIYVALRRIELSDPDNCLARKLFSLNLSTTPFRGYYYDDIFTFFNCSRVDPAYKSYVIPCLSGSNYTVTATSSGYAAQHFLTTDCKVINKVKFSRTSYYSYYTSYDIFSGNLVLTWDIPCGYYCGGRCVYKNSSTFETTCIEVPKKGVNGATLVAVIISIIIIIAICLCGICRKRSPETRSRTTVSNNTASSTVIVTTVSGLDTRTLNSYSKCIIGESGRLPNPENDTCPICMSMYKPKDTIKSIPECSHYFHVDCIDIWLRLNATCPVCRMSPLPKTL